MGTAATESSLLKPRVQRHGTHALAKALHTTPATAHAALEHTKRDFDAAAAYLRRKIELQGAREEVAEAEGDLAAALKALGVGAMAATAIANVSCVCTLGATRYPIV